jgi:hypothetical protein
MTINFGKRNGGALTAASPGDTLYIPLNFYNDSGASISIGSSLAVTDIEVFKNGGVAQRATDSGYAILGDTGNFDERIGFKGISISLFNTADDPSFYAVGSSYWVAIDSVTVDARTVRFFPAVFEIGEPRANVVQVNGDTGAADVLQKFAGTAGTLSPTGGLDTGSVDNNSYLTADTKRMSGDTGAADVLRQFAATNGTLSPTGELDTGSVANNSYLPGNVIRWLGTAAAAPTLAGVPKVEVSSFADTGIQDRLNKIASDTDTGIKDGVWDSATRTLTANTNLSGLQVSVTAFSDTGVNDRLAKILADTDTGIQSSVNVTSFADTGVNQRLSAIATEVATVDTATSAIKAKTDSLTFTVAGNVDANIQRVNDVAVSGTGAAGDEWGP